MSEETEKAGRYRLFAARLRAIAAEDVTQENCDLLHQVADDFGQMAGDLEAIDQLNRSIPKASRGFEFQTDGVNAPSFRPRDCLGH